MILTNSVNIKITNKNIKHFSKYFENLKLKDIISINPIQLQKGSNSFIDVKCDICGVERNIKYQSYYKNINSCDDHPIYTCDRCSHIKIKSHNRKKWGVDYFSQTSEYNDKFKKTMKDRWGVEYAQQSDVIREKTKKTNLEKFGFENPFMDNEMIRNKFKEKWGVDHPSKLEEVNERTKRTKKSNNTSLSSPEIRDKIKETNNLRYNGHPMKNVYILNKMKNTNLEKWRVEYNFQSEFCKEKIKNSNLKKFGVDNPMKSEEIRSNFIISNDKNYIKYLGERYSLFYCEKGHEFSIQIDNYHSRIKNNTSLCTVCNPIGDSKSIKENELFNFIKSIYMGEVIQSYRDGLEIDVYLPDLKIGFEFNGLYWHSEQYKDKWYHLNKTKYFSERGVRIIHIWEDDWSFRRSIIESQIRNWIGLTPNKIFARKCIVSEIKDSKISSKFLNENHIQGLVGSILKLGLFYKGELISLMTLDNYEGRSKMELGGWNINRFCNKLDMNVVGGASKLFKHFIRSYSPVRVISYADRDWSVGNLYENLGFSKLSESKPDYKYIVDGERVNKSRFRKSKLKTNLTESQEMKKSHIFRIWDCGKVKFEFLN